LSFVSDINEDILGSEDSPVLHQSPKVNRVKRDVGGKMECHFKLIYDNKQVYSI